MRPRGTEPEGERPEEIESEDGRTFRGITYAIPFGVLAWLLVILALLLLYRAFQE